jgi:zinc transporter
MNEHASVGLTSLKDGLPDANGLFFTCHFDAEGLATDDAAATAWTWRCHHMGDHRSRHAITADENLPLAVREALTGPSNDCRMDLEDGWMIGDLPDLRHDYSQEARGLGHFRFAFDERMLICAAKQPLRSIEIVRRAILSRTRRFTSPADVIEAVMRQSMLGMSGDIAAMSTELDGIEDRIVADAWHNERQALVEARRRLVLIHRQMTSATGVLRDLDHAHRHDLEPAVADMAEKLWRQAQSLNGDIEQLQARARLLQDELMANLTTQSNRLLYMLSVMTAVLLPATIISGLFGMNVGGLPFLQNPAGFWIVAGLSLLVAGGTLFFVRRMGDGR